MKTTDSWGSYCRKSLCLDVLVLLDTPVGYMIERHVQPVLEYSCSAPALLKYFEKPMLFHNQA